jgi:hypothetical protein
MRITILAPCLSLALLLSPLPSAAGETACPAAHETYVDTEHGWSACVPSGWSRRERGSEVVWSPAPGLDLVFSFQLQTLGPRDVSAPLVAFLEKKGATLHVSPSGQLKFHLAGVDGVGLVTHQHRFGMLVYTRCDAPGEGCEALVRKAIELNGAVAFEPSGEVPYDEWKALETGGLVLHAPRGSPAAADLTWLGEVYAKGYAMILDALGVKASKAPLSIYFYRSGEVLNSYTRRGHGFNIPGGPGEVHSLFASRGDRQSTGHEMVHAITRRSWGAPGQALLGEGIAVAMDLSGIDQHARAAKAIRTHEPAFTLASLLGQSWWSHDMELSYGVSGSVVTFLLAEGSVAKVKALYQATDLSASLQAQYGWTVADLEARWRKAIHLD